jgi:hypothetical protein
MIAPLLLLNYKFLWQSLSLCLYGMGLVVKESPESSHLYDWMMKSGLFNNAGTGQPQLISCLHEARVNAKSRQLLGLYVTETS